MAAPRTAPTWRSACRFSTASELIGFSVTTAHHLDIGAHTPGSCGIVDAVDAYAEGLQFKAIKVVDAGRRNDAVWRMVRDNIRIPDLVVGDMNAQIAAARSARSASSTSCERYGRDTVNAACEDLMDYSERLMRRRDPRLPDGIYCAEGLIDGYLDDPDPAAARPEDRGRRSRSTGDELTVDLTGTAPQVADRPINMPLEGTVDVRDLADAALDPARQRRLRQHSAEQRPDPADHDRGAEGHARQPDLSGADDRPLLSRQHARRHA